MILDEFGRTATRNDPRPASPRLPATGGRALYAPPPELKIQRANHAQPIARLTTRHVHRMMVADGRTIAEIPDVHGAIKQKSDYVGAAGWTPEFTGADSAWGTAASEALAQADKICCTRGPLWNFDRIINLAGRYLDHSGEFYVHLTETPTGFPRFQLIEPLRIGQRDQATHVTGGPFDGAPIINGIVYSRTGEEIAYHYLADDPAADRIIPATILKRFADPEWCSEGRGIPRTIAAAKQFYRIETTRDAEQMAATLNSRLTLIESNETGKKPDLGGMITGTDEQPTASGAQPEVFEEGYIRFIKNGGALNAHESKRPSSDWRAFDRGIAAVSIYSIGWRIEMRDLSELTGAGVRGFQDNINTTIYERHRLLAQFSLWLRLYQLAKLMQPPKDAATRQPTTAAPRLAFNAEWWKWIVPQPPEFNVDPARSIKSDIEAIRGGIDILGNVVSRTFGVSAESYYRKRARDWKLRRRVSAEEDVPVEILDGLQTMPGDPVPLDASPEPDPQQ